MPLPTRLAAGVAILGISLTLAACGGGNDGQASAASPEDAITNTLADFYSSLGDDAGKACALLSSNGQHEVVNLFNSMNDPDSGAESCGEAAGTSLSVASLNVNTAFSQSEFSDDFGASLRRVRDVVSDPANVSADIGGSTATVTLDGVDAYWQDVRLKKFGDDWRVESFVTFDAF